MGKRPDPLFLERGSYRQRRLLDAVRLLVFLGFALWMIPLLWPGPEDGQGVPTSAALFYVFGVWLVLIGLAAYLASKARLLTDDKPPEGQGQEP